MPTKRKEESDTLSSSEAEPMKRQRKTVERLIDKVAKGDGANNKKSLKQGEVKVLEERSPLPTRNANGEYVFPDFPQFRPNLSPKEILQMGSFGGTYFRSIQSAVTGLKYANDQWKEFPADWFEKLNIARHITSNVYDVSVNKFKETCGGDLAMWEGSGWITHIDPYGWFQWYCRFFLGRRSTDDDRQVSRGLGVMGATGRWRRNLTNKCLASGLPVDKAYNNVKISPKIRQLLQHWGYELTLKDLQSYKK